MKKIHFILLSSLIFILLFYNEGVGVNLALFGLALIAFICYFFQEKFSQRLHLFLVITSVLSCFAFAWYGDFVSFLALFLSIVFLQFKVQDSGLKLVQVFPLIFLNGITTLGRVFMFSQYLSKRKVNNNLAKKLIAYGVIPAVFLGLFFVVYSFGSNHFSSLFTDYYLDLDVWHLVVIAILGFYFSFTFWNYWIPEICYEKNSVLDNDFNKNERIEAVPSFSFLDIDFERKSGEITLFLLNLLLVVFIVTYNYEQFFEAVQKAKLSADTHERVNAVIFSIIMAVGVILFYFKSGFNFDVKANSLKKLAKIWIVLNAVLIVSTLIKNAEYVSYYGLTYKRLGVCVFLILAIIGLFFSFTKIIRQKTNAFLFNQMVWYCYGTILLCSYVNWGNLITHYNIAVNKGVDPNFLRSLNYNDNLRNAFFEEENIEDVWVNYDLNKNKKATFLSKALYYEFVETE
ncbi:DUF4153 domain-containing protein [Flavobacterium daejeonense]|uniref:DUF4153 domain-containing protein n=1 Tax=Flavobacterium daejeonense TaxID=350893 RepID=UPI00047AE91D|nr:DUF4173 domain-containing protein [Flavobacterium daejeonense]